MAAAQLNAAVQRFQFALQTSRSKLPGDLGQHAFTAKGSYLWFVGGNSLEPKPDFSRRDGRVADELNRQFATTVVRQPSQRDAFRVDIDNRRVTAFCGEESFDLVMLGRREDAHEFRQRLREELRKGIWTVGVRWDQMLPAWVAEVRAFDTLFTLHVAAELEEALAWASGMMTWASQEILEKPRLTRFDRPELF